MPNRRYAWRASLLTAAFAAVALAAIWGLSASPAVAAQKAIWGPTTLPGGGSAFPTYAELGVDVFQIQLDWAHTAAARPAAPRDPSDPAYGWPGGVGFAVSEAAKHGIQVALMVKGTPAWAVADLPQGVDVRTRAPSSVGDYADFLVAASARYPTIHRWMVWGETNRHELWTSGPVAYADLLDAAYAALKPVPSDPDTVVGGMTFSFGDVAPAAWLAALVRSDGGRPRLDEYGHNPFTHRCPDLGWAPDPTMPGARDISDVDSLIDEVRAAFGQPAKLWLSEFTVSSDRPNRALSFFVDRSTQADWLRRAYDIVDGVDYVSGLGWFNLHDEPFAMANGLTTGLMTYEGTRKPAFDAYRRLPTAPPMPSGACASPSKPAIGPKKHSGAIAPRPARRAPAPADRRRPGVRLRLPDAPGLARLLRGRYALELRCDERCRVGVSLLVGASAARKLGLGRHAMAIARSRAALRRGRPARVSLRVSRRAAPRLARARRLALRVELVATDAAGNATSLRRRVVLRR